MARFRKKPVEIEAVQYDGTNTDVLAVWGATPIYETDALAWSYDHGAYILPNGRPAYFGEGGMHPGCLLLWVEQSQAHCLVRPGMWVIREPGGEGFYPCTEADFALGYEPVEEVDG